MTFLFTDLEGSTAKWEQDPEAMARALRVHDTICADAVRGAGGTVIKMTGDGCNAAFSDAISAVEAALSMRRHLAQEGWPESIGPLQARMAIHTGPAEERDGDYFGPTLNRVARLMSAGHGGQILLSEATRHLILDGSYPLSDLGEHRLRDLLRPEHIFQLGDLDERFPPLRTLDALSHNLPAQVTAFIGREQELEDLVALIPTAPLVTLTGPGGTGKTRLALQAAAELVDEFQSVSFIPLASVLNPDNLGSAIADGLGLHIPGADPTTALAAHLSSRRFLLLLDNFEQLIPSAPLIGSLLDAAPDLRVLFTSRELLRLRAERNYPVAPLDVPQRDTDRPTSELARYEAIRLFEIRARAVRPDFKLDDSNARDVAAICRRLDGLPLAIELAAARARLFTPAQMRSALASDLGLLGKGPRDAPQRHQTLVDTIGWSYELLNETEKTVFRRLAAFVGGCGMEALGAVALHDLQMDPVGAAETLADKSLVRVEEGNSDEPRVEMLETIRAYARSRLEAAGEMEHVLGRHAAYFVELSERAESQLRRRDQERWMRRLDEERSNIQAALSWSFEEGDPVPGLRLVAALRDYWFYQGQLREMGGWTGQAMAKIEGPEPALKAGVLLTAGVHAYAVYRKDAADLLRHAGKLYEAAGDGAHRALALIFEVGARESLTSDIETTRRGLEEGISLARRAGAIDVVAMGLTVWGELERSHGNYLHARQIQEDALEIARETGELRRVAMILNNLGLIAHHLGDDEEADGMIRESLHLSLEIGFEVNAAHSLMALAEQIARRGDPDRGARLIGATDVYFERLGLIAQPGDAPDFDRIRAHIQQILGEDAYQAQLVEGSRLELDQAIELALSG